MIMIIKMTTTMVLMKITEHSWKNQEEERIFQSTGQENNTAKQKQISDLPFHLIFHRLSPFNCCLSVVL